MALLVIPTSLAAQHGQIGTYLEINTPMKSEMPKMNTNGSFGIEGSFIPFGNGNMLLSLKGSLGYYSRQTLPQTYAFENGVSTTTDVEFTSYLNQAKLGLKFYTGNETSLLRFFITPQVGMTFMRTRILIKEPNTESFCNPLERRKTHGYSGLTFGGELGMEADMNRIFKTVTTPEKHRMYFSVGYLNSFRSFDYVNIRYMKDSQSNSENSRELNATFQDNSATIYEKKIAEIYSTKLQFISFTLGYVYNF